MALAGVRAFVRADTALDADPHDTAARASKWLTPAFAAAVREYPPAAAPGRIWAAWARHRAYVRVSASLGVEGHPADTASTAYRQVIVVLQPIGRDGWRGSPITKVAFVTLSWAAGQWRIADVEESELASYRGGP